MLVAALVLLAPQSLKIDDESFRDAATYSANARGLSVLVLQNGKVRYEEYSKDRRAIQGWPLASGTKSFAGVLAMAAQEDGLLHLDERASATLPEWKSDPRRSQITIRHLLNLTSGLDSGELGRPPTYSQAIEARAKAAPGTTFAYGPNAFQAFGEILSRKLSKRGETVYSYLKRRVLDPVGMRTLGWRGQLNGAIQLPNGAIVTPREWAKLGQMMLGRGDRVLRPASVAEMLKGTKPNPGYGLTWWLNKPGTVPPRSDRFGFATQFWPGGPQDAFMAAGAANQRLYVIPSLDAVIVRQGRQAPYSDREFLNRLFRRR
ncbi:MAG: serine hydrolase domain-containing protein [Fimbriimonas sp.]